MRQTERSLHSRGFWHYVLAGGLTALLMLWRLGHTVLDGREVYVAATAVNMTQPDRWLDPDLADGPLPPNTPLNHWLIPVFNGQPRLVKTPLAYWCVAGLAKLGMPLDEFTARLPSALSAVLLVVVTLALGRAMFPARPALVGALMLATSLALLGWGRNARADMQMCFWMSLAMVCFYRALDRPRGRKYALLLAGAFALGAANLGKPLVPLFLGLPVLLYLSWRSSESVSPEQGRPRTWLLKYLLVSLAGFVAYVLVRTTPALQWWVALGASEPMGVAATGTITLGLPVAAYFVRCKGWRQLWPLTPMLLPGLIAMTLPFVPWMVYIADTFPQAAHVFSRQTVERGMGTGGLPESSAPAMVGYYLVSLAKWALPWIAFLPGAAIIPLTKRFQKDRQGLVFLFLWVYGLLLLFSASMDRHEQYILPALPAACLLMGYCAEEVFFGHRWISAKLAAFIVNGHAVALTFCLPAAAVAVALAPHDTRPKVVHILVIAGLAAPMLWLAVLAMRAGRLNAVLACLVVASAVGNLGFNTRLDLWNDKWNDLAGFARNISANTTAARLAAWRQFDPTLIWYLGRDLPPATTRRDRLVRLYGKDQGQRIWQQWLYANDPALYIVGEKTDVAELSACGFEPEAPIEGNAVYMPLLFRRQQTPPGH